MAYTSSMCTHQMMKKNFIDSSVIDLSFGGARLCEYQTRLYIRPSPISHLSKPGRNRTSELPTLCNLLLWCMSNERWHDLRICCSVCQWPPGIEGGAVASSHTTRIGHEIATKEGRGCHSITQESIYWKSLAMAKGRGEKRRTCRARRKSHGSVSRRSGPAGHVWGRGGSTRWRS